jgi:hypothetical protein
MPYVNYYTVQSGHGLSDIGAVYRGSYAIQDGRGIGSIFSGLARFIKPLFFSGMEALTDQALTTGKNIIKDIGNKSIHDILKEQAVEATQGLAEKAVNKLKREMQGGSGKTIKRLNTKKNNHLRIKRSKKYTGDIFEN